MEKMDMVLCGAEGVVESGGIINKVNTVKWVFSYVANTFKYNQNNTNITAT